MKHKHSYWFTDNFQELFTPFNILNLLLSPNMESALFTVSFLISDKAPSEATFRGVEYLYYDMGRTGGEPIVSNQDAISLYFKTRHPSGLIFHTGESSYLLTGFLSVKSTIFGLNMPFRTKTLNMPL